MCSVVVTSSVFRHPFLHWNSHSRTHAWDPGSPFVFKRTHSHSSHHHHHQTGDGRWRLRRWQKYANAYRRNIPISIFFSPSPISLAPFYHLFGRDFPLELGSILGILVLWCVPLTCAANEMRIWIYSRRAACHRAADLDAACSLAGMWATAAVVTCSPWDACRVPLIEKRWVLGG